MGDSIVVQVSSEVLQVPVPAYGPTTTEVVQVPAPTAKVLNNRQDVRKDRSYPRPPAEQFARSLDGVETYAGVIAETVDAARSDVRAAAFAERLRTVRTQLSAVIDRVGCQGIKSAPTLARVAVSERAVVQRINRKLRSFYDASGIDLHELKKTRGARGIQELGGWYVLDCRANIVIEDHVDPEEYARELGVLAPFEMVHDADTAARQ